MPAFADALAELATQPTFLFPDSAVPGSFRRAAVLLLFVADEADTSLVLTRRASRMPTHAGEISFPGGRIEPGESAIDAALREAEEEIGLDRRAVTVHGRLDDAWAFGGYVVAPIVGSVRGPGRFSPTSAEVDAVLLPSLATLIEPARVTVERFEYGGVHYANTSIALDSGDALFGLSADLWLEVRDRTELGSTARGEARLAELRDAVAAGSWPGGATR